MARFALAGRGERGTNEKWLSLVNPTLLKLYNNNRTFSPIHPGQCSEHMMDKMNVLRLETHLSIQPKDVV